MARVGRVVVKGWKGEGENRHLELEVFPAKTPVASASGKSMLKATESVRLENGDQLAVNLYEPKPADSK
jgi:hypothetical protein